MRIVVSPSTLPPGSRTLGKGGLCTLGSSADAMNLQIALLQLRRSENYSNTWTTSPQLLRRNQTYGLLRRRAAVDCLFLQGTDRRIVCAPQPPFVDQTPYPHAAPPATRLGLLFAY